MYSKRSLSTRKLTHRHKDVSHAPEIKCSPSGNHTQLVT